MNVSPVLQLDFFVSGVLGGVLWFLFLYLIAGRFLVYVFTIDAMVEHRLALSQFLTVSLC